MGAIGLFDSGVGGLSVLRRLRELLPKEDYIYFADSFHMPYGPRSSSEIEAIVFGICDFLVDMRCKAIVMACNTSSALVLPLARERYSVPIIGVLEPGSRAAMAVTRNGSVGVMATEATIRSRAYVKAIKDLDPLAHVTGQACPALAPLVEHGDLRGDEVNRALKAYITPLLAQGIDTLVLGCTHYPFLYKSIGEIIPESVRMVDPAEETAKTVKRIVPLGGGSGHTSYYVSGSPEEFSRVAAMLLSESVEAQKVRFIAQGNRLLVELE